MQRKASQTSQMKAGVEFASFCLLAKCLRTPFQCRLILAAGKCDAGAKMEFHDLLPEGKNWRGLSQIWQEKGERSFGAGSGQGQIDAGTKTEFHAVLLGGQKMRRGLSQIFPEKIPDFLSRILAFVQCGRIAKCFTLSVVLVILRAGDGIPPGVSAPNRPQELMMPTDNPATGR
jgi:hypothetical protein